MYEKAIKEVCNVMAPYARNGNFKAYGFGGIPEYIGDTKVSRLWNINGTNDPFCFGTQGVLNAYKKCILGTRLAGPTYFGEFLNKIKSEVVYNISKDGLDGNKIYSVCIILTDGNCHDMGVTTDLLVAMSKMPFSAVVLGVGEGTFEDMEILDADDTALVDRDGTEALRDIVQLVKYRDFKDLGMRELALAVLGEIPDQFVDYNVLKQVDRDALYNPHQIGADAEIHLIEEHSDEGDSPIVKNIINNKQQ